jgi:alkylation response protein AidB-like acyl-CoA dehydrogenase
MDLELPPDRELLRKTTAQYLRDRWPLTRVREAAERGETAGGDYLAEAADLGWFAMFIADGDGGGSLTGEPAADCAVIADARGAALAPGPLAAANAAAALITRAGRPGQRARFLTPMTAGEAVVLVTAGGDALWGSQELTATVDGEDLVLHGSVGITDGPSTKTHVLVVTGDPVRAAIVPQDLPGVRRVPMGGLDLTRRAETVLLDGVRLPPDLVLDATAVDALAAAVTWARTVAVTLGVAETVGTLRRLFDMTRAYALDRIAFGRPVGSFQAIKHLLADMSLVVEQAQAVSAAAVRALDAAQPFAAEVSSIAKVFVAERGPQLAHDCLQVHGGIGFAWEHDLHLFLRRIAADAALTGTADWHRELILAAHHDELEAV